MIEGITVLAQNPEMGNGSFIIPFLIALAIFEIIALFTAIAEDDIAVFLILSFFGVMLSGAIGTFSSEFNREPIPGKYIYEVTIDESVNFNEVYEKYEIISQNGKIYTIKEKDK